MYPNWPDAKDELTHPDVHRSACEMQRAGDVDVAMGLNRVLLMLVVTPCSEMDGRINAGKRGLPIGVGPID